MTHHDNNKKRLAMGLIMLAGFTAVLVVMFLPVFKGHNGLNFMDNLYNMVSKGSAYFIPGLKKSVPKLKDGQFKADLELPKAEIAQGVGAVLKAAGAEVAQNGKKLTVKGDLVKLMMVALADSDYMYKGDGAKVKAKYNLAEKRAMWYWWMALGGIEKSLKFQKKFAQAKVVHNVNMRAVECAYNYYGIPAKSVSQEFWLVIFSLVFYVVYTVWYGFGVMFVFEGLGLQLGH